MVDLDKRHKIASSLKADQKPQVIHPYYIMCKFSYSSYHVIGCADAETAWKLHDYYTNKADMVAVSIQKEYPYEVYELWKKKD